MHPIPSLIGSSVAEGLQLLLPSPFASVAAQAHLLKISGCKSYLYAAPLKPMVEEVYSFVGTDGPILKQIPDVSALLDTTKAATVAYTKSWDEASKDPWLIFHTSGTTGTSIPASSSTSD